MIELNAPVWKTLYSAGNDAEKWLRCLVEGDGDIHENIEILAEDLSHQLSYYSTTAYTLPHLAALCSKLSQKDKLFLIAKMGAAIAAEVTAPLSPNTEPFQEFQEGLAGLRQETKCLVTDPDIAALLKDNIWLGQEFALSALTILGDRKHAYDLYLLSAYCWEEGHAACTCGWNEEMFPLAKQPDCLEPIEIGSWDGKSLEDEAVWFHGLLKLAGDKEISPVLPFIYGMGICPDCGKREPYWAWLDHFMEEY